jgi:hypothetical protein
MSNIKSVAIDFDGVINDCKGWKGIGIFSSPIEGAKGALQAFKNAGVEIIIHTTRGETGEIAKYLSIYKIPFDHINYSPFNSCHMNPGKPLVDVYIDDRALNFDGKWTKEFVHKVLNFQPHYKKEKRQQPSVEDMLIEDAKTYKMKKKDYGDSYCNFGRLMLLLFPNGIELVTEKDFNKFGIFMQIANKFMRYSNLCSTGSVNFESIVDTLKDMGIYSFMGIKVENRK